jgi:hypothetical protein
MIGVRGRGVKIVSYAADGMLRGGVRRQILFWLSAHASSRMIIACSGPTGKTIN